LARVPATHACTQAVISILTKVPVELIGRFWYLGKPKVRLALVLLVRVVSLHALVTGVSVIAPVIVEELFTQRRSRACLMSAEVVPAGKVAVLNFRNARIVPVALLNTLTSPVVPRLVVGLAVST
jgi:hypothetical protein